MPRWLGITLAVVACLVVAALVVPLLWPVPPLEGVADPVRLAMPDSRFADIDGLSMHYLDSGPETAESGIIMLHGFGASTFSWREVTGDLSDRTRTVAFDRPPFGLTERPLPPFTGSNPYTPEANSEQLLGLMDYLGMERAVLIAHSAGAVPAIKAAVEHPERVDALVLVAPAVYEARQAPGAVSALLRSPQMRRVGPLAVRRIAGPGSDDFVRSAYGESFEVTAGVLAGYRLPLEARDWDRGLWELIAAPRAFSAADALDDVQVPTLVVAGHDDTFVPFENSRRVAESIIGARFVAYDETGHLPHEERPEQFVTDVVRFLDTLPGAGGG